MKLHRTTAGIFAEHEGAFHRIDEEFATLVAREDLPERLRDACAASWGEPTLPGRPLAPIGRQEVWAAGVTYERSRDARVEESRDAGGDSFYDRVYDAPRPELFFKASPWRVRGPGEPVRLRRDARWTVPEPEIALVVSPRGRIVGLTIGNDMSSRDIEGENPLYLSQAKIYDGACALGPAILVAETLDPATTIALRVTRAGATAYEG
ncbi:MAG TPA: fumarylacetoacetate hydrolase family protein, partial [Gemmatimonadaceae bacterium]|nr:fumarylacetoacetate hydrolase family protein [Gemmatimonadaceae bacterium]